MISGTLFKIAARSWVGVVEVGAPGVLDGVDSLGVIVGTAVATSLTTGVGDDTGMLAGLGVALLDCCAGFGSGGRTGGAGIKLTATAAAAKLDTPIVAGNACLTNTWLTPLDWVSIG